jgi:hypothetical protein
MSYIQQDLAPQARGDSWNIQFSFQDINSNPIDITGNQYWITLKSETSLSDSNAELQIGPVGSGSPDGSQGLLTIIIPAASTNTLEPKTYNYDLQEVTASGNVSTLLLGKIRVKADITRSATYSSSGSLVISSSIAGRAIYSGETSNTSTATLYVNGVNGANLSIQSQGILAFDALVTGRDNTTGNCCAFKLHGALKKDSSVTQLIGSVGKIILGKDDPTFNATIIADDGSDSLILQVTPASTNATRWAAEIKYTEVSF